MKLFEIISLPTLLILLVGGTNILTEVTKKVMTVNKAERVVLFWAEVLTLCATLGGVMLQGWTCWQAYVISGIVGMLASGVVAYAAMCGYDELYSKIVNVISGIFDYLGWKGHEDAEQ